MNRRGGGRIVVHLTIGIVDEEGGWWMKCRTFDYLDRLRGGMVGETSYI